METGPIPTALHKEDSPIARRQWGHSGLLDKTIQLRIIQLTSSSHELRSSELYQTKPSVLSFVTHILPVTFEPLSNGKWKNLTWGN